MDAADRLRTLIEHYAMSDRAFALRCGLKQATFDKQVRRTRSVSLETVVAVLDTFPDVSSDWLLRGEGEMLRTAKASSPDYDKMSRLVDTITILQQTINDKDKTIQLLSEQINNLKKQI